MTSTYGVVSMACGLGGNAIGVLRARGRDGSRFESVGAFDIDPVACADFEMLTGAPAQVTDLAAITAAQLRDRCVRRPDLVITSSPCKGLSACLSEELAKTDYYQALNMLALRCIDLVVEAWARPPAVILFENVPRITVRAPELLERIRAILWAKGYEIDQRTHDCGLVGGLAQKRDRFLLVARHRELAPSPLLRPPMLEHKSMSSVLWKLPVPTPTSTAGGSMHRLPKLAALNWLRLAAIRAGHDWKDLPASIGMSEDSGRQSGLYGVCDSGGPSHTIVARARAGNSSWASVADARLPARAQRQNGGFGVNASAEPSHAVVSEGSVRNTWVSTADPRLAHATRERGPWGVADPAEPSTTVIGVGQCSNSVRAAADPRLSDRTSGTRHAGIYGPQDPSSPAHSVIGQARTGKGWADVADPRRGFIPTHRLHCSVGLDASRDEWTSAVFELVGPATMFAKSGRPCHMVIISADGTFHRPLTTLELAVLQGFSPWHRPGDPADMVIGDPEGQWLELGGKDDGKRRERIGNAIPPPTAQAIAEQVLDVLDAGADVVFRLSTAGIWVQPEVGVKA